MIDLVRNIHDLTENNIDDYLGITHPPPKTNMINIPTI